jgi:hypothetical protein
MIVVRNRFTAKPGMASKLAAHLKEALTVSHMGKHRILTDMVGEFNQVVLEFEIQNLGEFEAMQKEYSTNAAFRDKMKGYTDLWTSGSREILQIV